MKLAAMGLRQRDGVSCGPAVAVLAGALLDPSYASNLTGSDELAGRTWFDAEQGRVHAAANRIWPRTLGTTPWGMAATISGHSARYGVRYGWRLLRRRDALSDVESAVTARWPVAMLVGNLVPRHWVLILKVRGEMLRCYEPSSGEVRSVSSGAIRASRVPELGFPRPFALVLPRYRMTNPRSNI
jgi:hypothetical protein